MAGRSKYQIREEELNKRFEILFELKGGGMGQVYAAFDTKFARHVAVKILHPSADRRRFLQEAFIASQFNHEHTVPIYEFGEVLIPVPHKNEVKPYPYMIMEYIEGRNFASAIQYAKLNNNYSEEKLMIVFDQICEPLERAHKKGLIHRDIKSPNVLLGRHGKLAILDWGIAKIMTGDQELTEGVSTTSRMNVPVQEVTAPGTTIGTLAYISPEQVHGLPVSPQTDIFLLGALLFEAYAGDPPYSYEVKELRRRQAHDDHSYEMPDTVPQIIQGIITHAMQPEPPNRHKSVAEFRKDLRKYLNYLQKQRYRAHLQQEQATPKKQKGGLLSRIRRKQDPDETTELTPEPAGHLFVTDIVKEWGYIENNGNIESRVIE